MRQSLRWVVWSVVFVLALTPAAAGPEIIGPDSGLSALAAGDAREELVPGIAHYSFDVPVGFGPYDVVRLHRVIREDDGPGLNKKNALFLLHGGYFGFEGAYLGHVRAALGDPSLSLAIYLAQRGVDVWGIDLGWTRIPRDAPDAAAALTGWGEEKDAVHLRVGLAFARSIRALTVKDGGPINLLGWSYGGGLGYAVLSLESQLPKPLRHVKGFIALDGGSEAGAGTVIEPWCDLADYYASLIDAGESVDSTAAFIADVGGLAETAPMDPSPFDGSLTNRQYAFALGLYPEGNHLLGGYLDANGYPAEFAWTDTAYAFQWYQLTSPHMPDQAIYQFYRSVCTPGLDDLNAHLADVKVPVFYLGAGAGNGIETIGDLAYLGSRDISSLVVRLHPPQGPIAEFSHVDLLNARDAPHLVYEPILDWLRRH